MRKVAAGGVERGGCNEEEKLSGVIPGAKRRARSKKRNSVSMKSKRVSLAAAAFALTLTAIPAQPAAAGPKQQAVRKVLAVEQKVEAYCLESFAQFFQCAILFERVKAALPF